jgi:hypothetical protein
MMVYKKMVHVYLFKIVKKCLSIFFKLTNQKPFLA